MSNSDSKRSRKKPIKPLSISSIHPSHIEPYFQKDLTKNPLRGFISQKTKHVTNLFIVHLIVYYEIGSLTFYDENLYYNTSFFAHFLGYPRGKRVGPTEK